MSMSFNTTSAVQLATVSVCISDIDSVLAGCSCAEGPLSGVLVSWIWLMVFLGQTYSRHLDRLVSLLASGSV